MFALLTKGSFTHHYKDAEGKRPLPLLKYYIIIESLSLLTKQGDWPYCGSQPCNMTPGNSQIKNGKQNTITNIRLVKPSPQNCQKKAVI